MFTGIVSAIGTISARQEHAGRVRITIDAPAFDLSNAVLGESIAVSGVCLTAIDFPADGFAADLSPETLACTTLNALKVGRRVNLERSLRLSDRLGGHLVAGHVDGVGEVTSCDSDDGGARITIAFPDALARYIARKGSVCVDGVSLTVADLTNGGFTVQLIPHTLACTTLSDCSAGTRVNLEVDLMARYLERLTRGEVSTPNRIDEALLRRAGFLK
jgi:riboflavin synthase